MEEEILEKIIQAAEIIGAGGTVVGLAELGLRLAEKRKKQPKGKNKSKGLRIFNIFRKKKEQKTIGTPMELEIEPFSPQKHPARVFISYKRELKPDEQLAHQLHWALAQRGHNPFVDKMLPIGVEWGKALQKEIEKSDYLLVLLSEESVHSEMVVAEVLFAEQYKEIHGRPTILPVRVDFTDPLPYRLSVHLDSLQYVLWTCEEDTQELISSLFASIEGDEQSLIQPKPLLTYSEHLTTSAQEETKISQPVPSFDPRLLEVPRGVVKLQSPLYIRRSCDERMERQILGKGSTTTIRAGRQMGKTSLLIRGAHFARENGYRVIYLDFQQMKSEVRKSLETLLRNMAEEIAFRLNIEPHHLEQVWSSSRGAPDKFNQFIESFVLVKQTPILLAIDEADQLLDADFKTDFFALLRAWDSRRAFDPNWEQLSIVLVISTHPHLLIDDYRQSPFNVGLRLPLNDFTEKQVADLNQRHENPLDDEELKKIYDLLGGHPYLTRQAFYTLVDQEIQWSDLVKIAFNDPGPFSSHLHFYLWQLRDRPDLVAGILEVIRKHHCTDEMTIYRLTSAGLVKEISSQEHVIRCGLYEQYFKDMLNG